MYDLVLDIHNIKKLNDLVLEGEELLWLVNPELRFVTPHMRMLKLLTNWVPTGYVICAYREDYFMWHKGRKGKVKYCRRCELDLESRRVKSKPPKKGPEPGKIRTDCIGCIAMVMLAGHLCHLLFMVSQLLGLL